MTGKLHENPVEEPARAVRPPDESSGVGRTVVWLIIALVFVAELTVMMWYAAVLKGRGYSKPDLKPAGISHGHAP